MPWNKAGSIFDRFLPLPETDYIKMLDELRPDCLYPKQTVIIDRDWATFYRALLR